MTGWKRVPLGEIASITKGVSYKSSELRDTGRVMVNLKNVAKGGGFRPEGNKFFAGEAQGDRVLRGGDLLIAYTDLTKEREILGCPVMVPSTPEYVGAVFSMDLGRISPDPNVISTEFLAYWLQSPQARAYMRSNASGATVMHLRTASVPAMEIPLPSLDEQRRIVAKLDEASKLCSAISTVNADLEVEARSLRTVVIDAAIADAGVEMPLADLCNVFVDGDWIESKDQSASGIRLVQTGNVGHGYFKPNDERARFISEETFVRLRCTEVLPGDCLVSRLPEPVGRACIVPDTGGRMITAVDCTIIRPTPTLLAEYFVYVTQTSQYSVQIQNRSTGTTRTRISRKNLGQVRIPVPSIEEQESIVCRLDGLDEKLSALISVAETRRDLAGDLMSRLLRDLMESGQ